MPYQQGRLLGKHTLMDVWVEEVATVYYWTLVYVYF